MFLYCVQLFPVSLVCRYKTAQIILFSMTFYNPKLNSMTFQAWKKKIHNSRASHVFHYLCKPWLILISLCGFEFIYALLILQLQLSVFINKSRKQNAVGEGVWIFSQCNCFSPKSNITFIWWNRELTQKCKFSVSPFVFTVLRGTTCICTLNINLVMRYDSDIVLNIFIPPLVTMVVFCCVGKKKNKTKKKQ